MFFSMKRLAFVGVIFLLLFPAVLRAEDVRLFIVYADG